MQRCFFPGSIDYDGAMSHEFNSGRAISLESMAAWRHALEPYIKQSDKVLDLGAGTGRFSILIADWFNATVFGVEPAKGMREVAVRSGGHRNVFYVGGRAEKIPLGDSTVAATLLSNVYHHVVDKAACAAELRRVLKSGGRVLIRGAFAGRLDGIKMFDYFPEAKAICEQFPTLDETQQTFRRCGFEFETIARVTQQTCASLKELAERTRLRADTTLALMTDDDFTSRQQALERAAAIETIPTPVIETLDLLVLQKPVD